MRHVSSGVACFVSALSLLPYLFVFAVPLALAFPLSSRCDILVRELVSWISDVVVCYVD
jgi:hypothetical protein